MKSIEPAESIILTMPVAFFNDRNMTHDEFREVFEEALAEEDGIWNFLKSNLPTQDVAFVYIVFGGMVQYRTNLVCYERGVAKSFDDAPDGIVREFPPSNWILISGPAIRAPYEIPMKGFQGHRYSKVLF